jgi:transposase
MSLDHHFAEPTAIRTNLGAIFVSLELSRSTWLITSLSPGGGEKMSKHGYPPGISLRYWRVYLRLSRKRLRGPDNPSRSSSFRRRD